MKCAVKREQRRLLEERKGDDEEKRVPQHLRPHAWFVSYAPSSDPKIAISVIVEHGEHGSSAAAPIARELDKMLFESGKRKK